MAEVTQEVLEEVLDTLYHYGTQTKYFDVECKATGLTLAQDDGGELARNMAHKLEQLLSKKE